MQTKAWMHFKGEAADTCANLALIEAPFNLATAVGVQVATLKLLARQAQVLRQRCNLATY